MSLADIKAISRQALHDFMSRPASLYDSSGVLFSSEITARRHDVSKLAGDLAGTNLSYAEVHERPTTVVLWKAQIAGLSLRRGCLILFAEDEGWFVETVKPADGLTVTVEVSTLSPDIMLGKTLPGGVVIGG